MSTKEDKKPEFAKRDLLRFNEGLISCGNLKGVDFAYNVAKNKRAIADEVESIKDSVKPTEEFTKYDEKRGELAKELSDKDEHGNPKTHLDGAGTQQYSLTDNKPKFDKKLEALKKEYKEAVEARDKQLEEFEELLKKETSAFGSLKKIDFDDLPKEITSAQLDSIFEMINEK